MLSMEFSEPERITEEGLSPPRLSDAATGETAEAEETAAAAAAAPAPANNEDMNAAAATLDPLSVGAVCVVDPPEDALLWLLELTTHFLMCFSNVEGTLNGIAQNLHLYMSLPILP